MATTLSALGIGSLAGITRAEIVMDGKAGLVVTLYVSPQSSTFLDTLADLPKFGMRLVPER
jgi:hypothetical protein